MNPTHATHSALSYTNQGEITVRLGKTLLFFGVAFNAYLGWTLGFGALAIATGIIVLLFDLAKMNLTKNAVMKHNAGEFPLFTGLWVIILTGMSMASATMFYAYNMHNVSKFVHENSSDVQTAQTALRLSTQQAEQYGGFNPLQAQQNITRLTQDVTALLARPATNSNNRPAGSIGSRTQNCTANNYYSGKYANECAQIGKLKAEINGLQQQISLATNASQSANQTANNALATLADFSIAEGIPGFAVLGRMFYPHLSEKEAANEVYSKANVIVAVITELLGTCMLLIGYSMMSNNSPAPLTPKPTGTDDDTNNRNNQDDYKTSRAGFNTPSPTTANHPLSPKAIDSDGPYRTRGHSSSTSTATGAGFSNPPPSARARAEMRWQNPAPLAGNTALNIEAKTEQNKNLNQPIETIPEAIPTPQKHLTGTVGEAVLKGSENNRTHRIEYGFQDFRRLIKNGELKPSFKPCKLWLKQYPSYKEMSMTKVQDIVKTWLDRLVEEGTLEDLSRQPNWKNGMDKYRLREG